jgi:hypothetical protein
VTKRGVAGKGIREVPFCSPFPPAWTGLWRARSGLPSNGTLRLCLGPFRSGLLGYPGRFHPSGIPSAPQAVSTGPTLRCSGRVASVPTLLLLKERPRVLCARSGPERVYAHDPTRRLDRWPASDKGGEGV